MPPEVREELFGEWGGLGYVVCYDCLEGRSSLCGKPPVKKFLEDVADFFGGDAAEHTFGCRAAQFAVMRAVRDNLKADGQFTGVVIADPNSHYSTNIAAEMNDLEVVEFPHNGYPSYTFDAGHYDEKIRKVKSDTGSLPALAVVTHADPYYGNIAPVEEIGKLCREHGVPLMLNAAYTGGVIPINMKELNVDFLTLSAHKSMMSLAPLGFVVTTYEWADRVFALSKATAAWTGRAFGKKIPNVFGCSIGGLPLLSGMTSFPHVKKRVKNWDEELRKTSEFVNWMEEIGDIMLLGQRPHRHHLLHFETPRLWEVSQDKKGKGFYIAKFMIDKGIVGLHRGMSKHIKFSVYGLSDDERGKVRDAFYELSEKSLSKEIV
ncbi:MAG: aminotransferase class V-fold PLP-dependent enzyme [bacterium]